MMCLRKIWAEGSFSVLKREHSLSKIRKRGIPAVTEECLLSVMALNLKRMVKAILLLPSLLKIRVESYNFQPGSLFVNPYLCGIINAIIITMLCVANTTTVLGGGAVVAANY